MRVPKQNDPLPAANHFPLNQVFKSKKKSKMSLPVFAEEYELHVGWYWPSNIHQMLAH